MDLYFAAAEQPAYIRTLEDLGVTHVAISYYEWMRRNSGEDVHRMIPSGMKVIITPGVARKEIDFANFAKGYIEFAYRNANECIIYDLDSAACPPEVRKEVRVELSSLPGFIPFPFGEETYDYLTKDFFSKVGVNASTSKSMDPVELRRIPADLYGSNITNPKTLRDGRLVASTTMAWLGPNRFGELWLFVRGKLRHFTADGVPRAVRQYADEITAFGVDPEACASNDHEAMTALAVKSLLAMEKDVSGRLRDRARTQKVEVTVGSQESGPGEAQDDGAAAPATSLQIATMPRAPELLPILAQNDQRMTSSGATARVCDNCNLSDDCPKYEAHHECAFGIPVSIRTDADVEAVMQTILEFQFERVSFGVFAEQARGGELTSKVGPEMDRLSKLILSVKEMKQSDRPTGGVLSNLMAGVTEPEASPDGQEPEEDDDVEDAEVLDERDQVIDYSGQGPGAPEPLDLGTAGWEADPPE
jgi:hypothetical protein